MADFDKSKFDPKAAAEARKQEMGRFVKKGEKGIRVMAPAPYKMEREQDKMAADGKPVLDKDGEPVPRLGVDELTGSVGGYATLMEVIKQASPVPISFENIESGAKGYFQVEENRIAIQEGMSEAQTVKTALHEASHASLHNKEAMNADELPFDSPEANQPAGYIEITPPVDMSSLKADTPLSITEETGGFCYFEW